MAKVLTTGSTIKCSHEAAIRFTSTATLRVDGAPVVRQIDLSSIVLECPPSQTRCTGLLLFQTSAVLRDADSPVVLATGMTTNAGACTIDTEHDVLQE
jgi:hypothetical protein